MTIFRYLIAGVITKHLKADRSIQKRKKEDQFRPSFFYAEWKLKQSADLSSRGIHVNPSKGRVGTGSRHKADSSRAGAEELGS